MSSGTPLTIIASKHNLFPNDYSVSGFPDQICPCCVRWWEEFCHVVCVNLSLNSGSLTWATDFGLFLYPAAKRWLWKPSGQTESHWGHPWSPQMCAWQPFRSLACLLWCLCNTPGTEQSVPAAFSHMAKLVRLVGAKRKKNTCVSNPAIRSLQSYFTWHIACSVCCSQLCF